MISSTTVEALGRLKVIGERLLFLKGNLKLAISWPLFALLAGVFAWHLLLRDLQHERDARETWALKEAEVLATSYAFHLSRTIEQINQIAFQVKYDWTLTNGNLRLEEARAKGSRLTLFFTWLSLTATACW